MYRNPSHYTSETFIKIRTQIKISTSSTFSISNHRFSSFRNQTIKTFCTKMFYLEKLTQNILFKNKLKLVQIECFDYKNMSYQPRDSCRRYRAFTFLTRPTYAFKKIRFKLTFQTKMIYMR